IRAHWQVENCLHWVLDVQFREDACRVRVGHEAQNFAILRHLALNLLRQEGTVRGSLAAKRFRAALDHTYLLRLLAGLAHAPTDGLPTTCPNEMQSPLAAGWVGRMPLPIAATRGWHAPPRPGAAVASVTDGTG